LTELRVGSFAFGSVDIQVQLANFEQTTILAAQKQQKHFFRTSSITKRIIKKIIFFKFETKLNDEIHLLAPMPVL
jgi:hypothetical protein